MAYLLIRSQVLIQGFATDSEFTSQLGLLLASLDTLAQFGNTLRRQGFLPATVGPALLGERDALALPLGIKARSNSANAPITDSIRFAIGESSPVKVKCSLRNSMRTPRW